MTRILRLTGLIAAGTVAAALLAGCGGAHRGNTPGGATKLRSLPNPEAGVGSLPPSGPPGGTGNGGGADQTGAPGNPRPTWSASPTPGGPQIVYFKVTQQPKCGGVVNGKHQDPVPAVIAWKASGGVTSMALSVDNPELVGGYRTYPGAQGSETFTFSCAPPAGTSETHTYTMNTVGGGPSRRAQFTLTAKSLPQS